jgi:hypothetical protein
VTKIFNRLLLYFLPSVLIIIFPKKIIEELHTNNYWAASVYSIGVFQMKNMYDFESWCLVKEAHQFFFAVMQYVKYCLQYLFLNQLLISFYFSFKTHLQTCLIYFCERNTKILKRNMQFKFLNSYETLSFYDKHSSTNTFSEPVAFWQLQATHATCKFFNSDIIFIFILFLN